MRYIIGIDLGTTNSCVAFVDTKDPRLSIQLFHIPQLTDTGTLEQLTTLPSFCYLTTPGEFPKGSTQMPWSQQESYIVGKFAKTHGAKVPTRLVQSAKSWLCHPAANRRDKILPIEADNEGSRISPVEATARYLAHIRSAWNAQMAKGDIEAEFEAQEIVLTVPASFDEVARSLTTEAARQAGFLQMTLLEEPQAAFYSWIAEHETQWQEIFNAGDKILVCDVGGGTTDFSLIDVVSTDDKLSFKRMAVGDHLLLGGDNMDAALAHTIEKILTEKGHTLSSSQRMQLLHASRNAKEQVLNDPKCQRTSIRFQGSGSSVVQGTLSTELDRREIEDKLLNGFFGTYTWDDAVRLTKTSGLRSMGLPYENEPSIVKHLAHFLQECSENDTPAKPDFILFNGGTMKPALFQKAVVNSLQSWFPDKTLTPLSSYHLDLAVARGAAYYGKARRGLGTKIGGGLPRSYYIAIEIKNASGEIEKKALTLMPKGAEEGDRSEPEMTFMLTPNTPVAFEVYASNVRLHDRPGDIIAIEPETMHPLPSLFTALRYGKKQAGTENIEKIPVHLEGTLTAIGTLEIGLKSLKSDHRWSLEFQVRRASGQEESLSDKALQKDNTVYDASYIKNALQLIQDTYSQNIPPTQLMEGLEKSLGISRREWPTSLIRSLADTVLKLADRRKSSPQHWMRWWNLAGFFLRPGFGFPADDFRIKELWKTILSEQKAVSTIEQQVQLYICYRRTAGGMTKGQQMHLAPELVSVVINKRTGKIDPKSRSELSSYSETIRALGSMELLDTQTKTRIGNALANRIASGEGISADYWALGRIGARHLVYGSVINVVPRNIVEEWITKTLDAPCREVGHLALLMEMLARQTEHVELNIAEQHKQRIIDKFNRTDYHNRISELLTTTHHLTQEEQELVLGDHLPLGLRLEE